MTTLVSPWTMLPSSPPYVLASDAAAIEQFNVRASPTHQLHTELLPEPYFGSRDAPVVLLGLNPGFSDDDPELHLRPEFLAASRRNLVHAEGRYPFQYLDPRFETTPGGGWWRSKLRPILDAGVDREVLAENLLCVEWFPYHSKTFRRLRTPLASQAYGFALVDAAVRRDALIIDMRSSALWSASAPALASHRRRHALRNPRNVTVSRRNYPGDFAALVALLRRNRTT